MKNKITLICSFLFFVSCEPDDICLSSTADTPKMILGFYDLNSGNLKEVNNLKIQGKNSDEIYFYQTIDSIGIPLKNLEQLTIYSLTKDYNESSTSSGNSDQLYINYNYNYSYISRACGFIISYDLENLIIEKDTSNWILNTEIIKTNISNEENIHVKIFH